MKNYKSNKPCIACGESRDGYVTFHHVYSKAAYPEYKNEPWNLMPVCQKHHNEAHSMPDRLFAAKYRSVQDWFDANGWEVRVSGKYYHEET
jgi:5-methylcytosine-specific restriction endonuclease McrA